MKLSSSYSYSMRGVFEDQYEYRCAEYGFWEWNSAGRLRDGHQGGSGILVANLQLEA